MTNSFEQLGKGLTMLGGAMKHRFTKVAGAVIMLGGVVGGMSVIAGAWDSAGLPRFAYASEVKNLSKQMQTLVQDGKVTRELLYYARKDSLEKELTNLEAQLIREPTNVHLRQRITSTKSQLQIIYKNLGLKQ